MCVAKDMEYFVGGLGEKVMVQRTIDPSMLFFCNPDNFSNHLYLHFLSRLIEKKSIFFCNMLHKYHDQEIDTEGVTELLYWITKNNPPFVSDEITPNIYLYGGNHTCKHLFGYTSQDYLEGKKLAYVIIRFNVLGVRIQVTKH